MRLLLTDLVMPLSGIDLAREVALIQPGIRVLFLSGYTDRDVANRAALRPAPLLEKPFTAVNLWKMCAVLCRKVN